MSAERRLVSRFGQVLLCGAHGFGANFEPVDEAVASEQPNDPRLITVRGEFAFGVFERLDGHLDGTVRLHRLSERAVRAERIEEALLDERVENAGEHRGGGGAASRSVT